MDVRQIFSGSDGEATRQLYRTLEAIGPVGVVAANLFRAQKCSSRAKMYRGRGGRPGRGAFSRDAYERKTWSLGNFCTTLVENPDVGIGFGWALDRSTPLGGSESSWILYVDLPTGQISFHSPTRFEGPDYSGEWDGCRDTGDLRVIRFCENVLAGK